MVRVSILIGNFSPRIGGAENYALGLAEELSKTHRLQIICFEKPSAKIDQKNEKYRIQRADRGFDYGGVFSLPKIMSWRQVDKYLNEFNPNLVICLTRFYFTSHLGVKWARKNNVECKLIELGGGFVNSSSTLTNLLAKSFDKICGSKVMKNASEVFALTNESANFVFALSGVKAKVIGSGIDIDFWSQEPPEKDSFNARGRQRFTFVGRSTPEKGLPLIIDSLMNASEDLRKSIVLNIATTSSPETLRLKKATEAWDYTNTVNWHLDAKPLIVKQLMQTSIFLNPSTAAEGLQTVLLEAFASGSRIITNDVPGARDLLKNNHFGVIFDFAHDHSKVWLEKSRPDNELERKTRNEILSLYTWSKVVKCLLGRDSSEN